MCILACGVHNPIAVSAESQRFLTFGPHVLSFEAVEGFRQIIMPVGGSLRNFYVQTASPQQGDAPFTLGIRVNGVDSEILITIPAGAPSGMFSDVKNEAYFAAGDLVSFRAANFSELGNSAALRLWSIGVETE